MKEMFGYKRDGFFPPKWREICRKAEFEKQQEWSVMTPHAISPGHLAQCEGQQEVEISFTSS